MLCRGQDTNKQRADIHKYPYNGGAPCLSVGAYLMYARSQTAMRCSRMFRAGQKNYWCPLKDSKSSQGR